MLAKLEADHVDSFRWKFCWKDAILTWSLRNISLSISGRAWLSWLVSRLKEGPYHTMFFSKLALFPVAAFTAVFVAAPPSPAGSGITNSCNGGQTYCCMSLTPFFFLPSLALSVLPVPQLPSLVPASKPGTRCTLFSLRCRIWYLHPRSTTQSACCSGKQLLYVFLLLFRKFSKCFCTTAGAVVVGCSPLHVRGP